MNGASGIELAGELLEALSQKQRLEQEVAGLRAECERRTRAFAMLTHDLRTPLTAARMCVELIRRSGSSEVQNFVARALGAIDRIDALLRERLDLDRARSGRAPLPTEACSLREILAETLDELADTYGERFTLVAPADFIGAWNRNAVRRIVENLANNAAKYGRPGAPITITLCEGLEAARILVHNWGSPLGKRERARLFQPFTQSEDEQRSHKSGWGLGLSIVREMANMLGGLVEVKSSPRYGTTFTVELPWRKPGTPSSSETR